MGTQSNNDSYTANIHLNREMISGHNALSTQCGLPAYSASTKYMDLLRTTIFFLVVSAR